MPPSVPLDEARLRDVVEELFSRPPVSDAELEQRLAGLDVSLLRHQLVARLQEGPVDEAAGSLIVAALDLLGVAEVSGSLEQLLADRERSLRVRAVALAVLLADAPGQLERLVEVLTPEEAVALANLWLEDLMGKLQADPGQAEAVAQALLTMPPALRANLLSRIEQARRREGTGAATCYATALDHPALAALEGEMLAAVIEEASREGLELLEQLQQRSSSPQQAHRLQQALIRLRTRRLECRRAASTLAGQAFIGSCDGQGAFIVVGCLQTESGHCSLVDLCLSSATGVRDGAVSPHRSSQDLERLLIELRAGSDLHFVEVPLAVAGALVAETVARSEAQGYPLPEEARPALAWFERLGEERELLPRLQPASRATLAELRQLLSRAEYQRSWYLSQQDLDALGVGAGVQLTAALQDRLEQMCLHMARWHHWRDEPVLAALLAEVAREVSQDLAGSALVQALRERTEQLTATAAMLCQPSAADEQRLRQQLRLVFFRDVLHPKGRDLARLDFAQVAYFQLLGACQGLPSARRPQADALLRAAHALGTSFADYLLAGASWPLELIIGRMTEALLAHCRLSDEESHALVALLLPALGRFIERVCASCPIACLDRPLAGVADAFFGTHEPGNSQQSS